MYQDGAEGCFVHDGMAALARTPVLPRATPVCAVSAPIEASQAAISNGCFTSTPVIDFTSCIDVGRAQPASPLNAAL
jgi:hypothetical protein